MIVEPFANDKLEDNLNPVGRLFYAASTMVCIPASLSQNGPGGVIQNEVYRVFETVLGFFEQFF